ncbi:MAG: Ribonuclease H [Candidatus Magasanikbacteria bacterium GW2011_GWA2_42_32]|uniref:Ribonuclease H n=1 Tax=Candidatus Magasanikbacteria bacterium GW2011_GWA2_42_32 TaxID=1619039 RepID=A0A0G1CVJ1_9BACT|nr:MAG: Ribonuclease H [Candidatus Magasanikbacteria bacterium GW2011_GWA2_42_32]
MKLIIFTDGGARGNPGPAAAGIVIKNDKGAVVEAFGKYLGETTNNQAEYRALLLALSIWNLSVKFKKISYHHIRREKNTEADKLVNETLDRQ